MKIVVFLFMMIGLFSFNMLAAPRISQKKSLSTVSYRGKPIVPELEKLPEDVRDQLLLLHGIDALTCVGQMMINNNNTDSVKQSGFNLLDAIKNSVSVLVRSQGPLYVF